MALSVTTLWEVETGGSDTLNGGAFDPGQTAGMLTDGAATVATGSSPVFTSASYNFVAGDVGAWIYIASGTNWIAGWYKIASVAANAATLNAAAGAGVKTILAPTTAAGCATTASPTGATWAIDYSQQSAAQFAYTDLASAGAGLTASSTGHPFGKQQVGNSVVITSGTNFTTGCYVIASVSGTTATFVGPSNITSGVGSGGHGGQGGAFASAGPPTAIAVTGNVIFIQSGTYTISSGTANAAAGIISDGTGLAYEGYGSVRGDLGTAPVLQITGSGTVINKTIFNKGANAGSAKYSATRNITLDGNNQTGIQGITTNQGGLTFFRITAKNCKNNGINITGGPNYWWQCVVTGCSVQPAFSGGQGSLILRECVAFNNTVTGFSLSSADICIGCLSYANSGASSDGFANSGQCFYVGCVAYGNGRYGFQHNSQNQGFFENCIVEGNASAGFKGGGVAPSVQFVTCAAFNNSTDVDVAGFTGPSVANQVTILSGSPFTSAAGGDFSLNSTVGAGASCRGAGSPGVTPDGTSTGHQDIGAIQSAGGSNSGGMIMERVRTGY